MKKALRYSFLAFLGLALLYAAYTVTNGYDRVTVMVPLLVATVVFNLAVESLIPFGNNKNKRPYGRDTIFTFVNIFITSKFGELLVIYILARGMELYFSDYTLFKASNLGPLWLQVTAAILLNEFVRYWSHFAQHKIPALWKLHAIHHSVKEIYSLNTFYSHPLDFFVRNCFSLPIVITFGFSTEAVMIATAFLAVSGVFSHSRANFRFSWLNYIFSTNQLHRWHHSTVPAESDKNFGVCLSIWDLVFGTWFLPKDREAPAETGLHQEHPWVPTSFAEVMAHPTLKPSNKEGSDPASL